MYICCCTLSYCSNVPGALCTRGTVLVDALNSVVYATRFYLIASEFKPSVNLVIHFLGVTAEGMQSISPLPGGVIPINFRGCRVEFNVPLDTLYIILGTVFTANLVFSRFFYAMKEHNSYDQITVRMY